MSAIRFSAMVFVMFFAAVAWILGTLMAVLAIGIDYVEGFFFWLFNWLWAIGHGGVR